MDVFDSPVCISQYFVNKQNVRSFRNIIKSNILKNGSDEEFCEKLLNGEFVANELPRDLLQILSTIRANMRMKCKDDFKSYFCKNDDSYLAPVNKEFIFKNTWNALCDIVPGEYFSCNQNRKILKNAIHSIIYSMKKQHLMFGIFIKKWDVSVQPWKHLPNSRKILWYLFHWIFRYILTAIICLNFHVTTCKLDADENKLYYFWKNEWQSLYDKQISKMVVMNVIKKSQTHSLCKRSRRNHSLADRLKLKLLKKEIPKLQFTLKPNNECRPIVCYKTIRLTTSEKYKIKDRLRFLRSLAGKTAIKIEHLHQILYNKWVKTNKPKLFFIKTDLSNAFGAINREKLAKILLERYKNYLNSETSVYKRKQIAQQFKDVVMELRKPILIRAGSTVYEWKEGLVQGYKYSPALSEIYYNYFDQIYFSEHINNCENQLKLFTRVVDDYMYITDSLDDAQSFLNSLTNYRNVNYKKTVVNFKNENINFSDEITFLGYCYNTRTMHVSRAGNTYKGQMCYKIAFTSGLTDVCKFIESRIGQSGIPISSHIFNLFHNSEHLMWDHVFTTFCLSANKFCTILAVLHVEKDNKELLLLYKRRVTVRLTSSILDTIILNKPSDFLFVYCINHFRYLSWKALYFCAKQTPKCNGLVPAIQVELAKTNCIFGKWREHASRIDTNGHCQRIAIKEICRKTDLRMVFRNFEKLPLGFQGYHHRMLE